MLLGLALFVHATTTEASTATDTATGGDHVIFINERQAAVITTANTLGHLQERKQWLLLLQNASTATDYICQTLQIILTVPQLAAHPSEEQGVWLNSFNLAAGLIALSQIPTKKWLQASLQEIEDAITRLQTAGS